MMERNELLRALRSTAADQHRCFGCGYEYKCSIRGCAINRAAAELIVQLAAENEALRHPTNPPLTLEELREMDGEPVWCTFTEESDCPGSRYMIIQWHNSEFFKSCECGFLLIAEYEKSWLAYRRRPEEDVSKLDTSRREEG